VADFNKLASLPGTPISEPYCRMLEKAILEKYAPPQFLYTSGRPGRYNLRDTPCLYCSADMPTAGAEYDRYRGAGTTQSVTYWIHVKILVLDLTDSAIVAALGLKRADLFAPWRVLSSPGPSLTQQLGATVATQDRLHGIRFPSDAAKDRGFAGSNLVLFRKSVVAPAAVVIKDDSGVTLDSWP
jgi:RES domain-containing protein